MRRTLNPTTILLFEDNRRNLLRTIATSISFTVSFLLIGNFCIAQGPADSSKKMPHYKNVIRYNLSGALLFGIDRYIVLGYERVISPRQSISVNVGRAALPGLISVITDSFSLKK